MKYQKLKLQDRYQKLMSDNKRLTKKLIELNSKLLICEQKYLSIESAFDLSQKLVQHLKTENQLLRSSTDLLSMNNPLGHPINHLIAITDGTDITNNPPNVTSDINQSIDNPNSDLCKSDLIAIQYEDEIKQLREEYSLMCCLPLEEVVIRSEDQINANSHLLSASESEYECEEQMDIDLNVDNSSKMSETSESKTENKCKYCGRKFAEESTLTQHKLLHKSSDGEQIRCAEDLCGFQFNSKHELKEHLKTIHKNKQNFHFSSLKAKFEMSQNKRIFECKECNKQLSSMQSLRLHQKSVHNIVSTFMCKFSGCELKFEKSSELRAHEEIHRKQKSIIDIKHTINTTPVTNGTPEQENTSKTTPKPVPKRQFVCSYEGCVSSFLHKTSLKRHEEKFHSNPMNLYNNSVVESGITSEGVAVSAPIPNQLQLLNLFYSEQQKITQIL